MAEYEGTLEMCQRYMRLKDDLLQVEIAICNRTGFSTVEEFLDGMRELLAPEVTS